MNLELICQEVCNICKETGSYILEEYNHFAENDIEVKGLNNFVTYVDKTSEKKLVNQLKQLLPGSGFLTEEKTIQTEKKKFTWIIDPLDGTTNFIHRVPFFSISIALQEEERTVLGIVYEPNSGECFHTWKNSPAFLNTKPITTTQTNLLADALIATGFPYSDFGMLPQYLELLNHLLQNSHGIRRLGSAALDLAYVACGRFDVFYEYGLNPWDVAAGAFLVQQAGGKTSDFSGKENYIFGKEIIASNKKIFDKFLNISQQYLTKPH